MGYKVDVIIYIMVYASEGPAPTVWVALNQLIVYHSLVLVHKIRKERKPVYLADKLAINFNYRTRLASSNGIRMCERLDSDMRKDSFVPRTSFEWNLLPVTLRNTK